MTNIDKINAEFKRIIGEQPGGYMVTAKTVAKGRVVITDTNTPDDEAIADVDGSDLLEVLALLPAGCPIDEGEDGSLWETLIELEHGTKTSAIRYAKEHHGERLP
jgi:hypothetical protein